MPRRRALVLAGMLLLVTAACGEGNEVDDSGDSGDTDLVPAQTAEPAPEPSAPSTPAPGALTLSSPAFADGGTIPEAQVCEAQGGGNESPALTWVGVPDAATSLALVMDDPDAPVEGGFVHWVVVDLDPALGGLGEGEGAGTVGPNGAGAAAYLGPCPPPGDPHTYVFTLYAFTEAPDWPAEPTRDDVVAASGTAVATAQLRGTFGNAG